MNTNTLLTSSLAVAVPLWCAQLQGQDFEVLQRRAQECSQYLAGHGDELLFKVPGKTAEAFNRTAEGIACAVLLTGSLTFQGITFTNPFDPEAAKNLSDEEVREKWPRGHCSECNTIVYAGYEHYLAGDW